MTDPASLLNQAIHLARSGHFDEAMHLAGQIPPSSVRFQFQTDMLNNRGRQADLQEGEKICAQWRKIDPSNVQPLFQLMQLYWKGGRLSETAQLAIKIGELDPSHKLTPYYQGISLQLNGDFQNAVAKHRLALQLNAQQLFSDSELDLEVAIAAYEVAAGHYPSSPGLDEDAMVEAHDSCDLLATALGKWLDTKPEFSRLDAGQVTRYSNACYNLACVDSKRFQGLERALAHLSTALQINPGHSLAHSNYLFVKNYDPNQTKQGALGLARKNCAVIRQQMGPPKSRWSNKPDPDRKLRIAYLSSDFCRHSVVYFITPVLEAHDPKRVQVHAYYTGRNRDKWTERVASAVDRFTLAGMMTDEEIHRQIVMDQIDILVDLNGFTSGHRVGALMRRAAPIQVSWIGYPGSTGLDVMDYRIVDTNTDPDSETMRLSSESLLYMDPVFSVYLPDYPLPEIAPETPALKNGYFTFGSFNALPKLNPGLFELWGRILSRVDGSKLLIKNRMLDQASVRRDVSEALVVAGIDQDRQILMGRTESPDDHLKTYRGVDLCLDSYPYNGTTTNCDSFIMGVPVLTLSGELHASRVTTSQLRALGLDRLITTNPDQYVEMAVCLASDKEALNRIHQGLRDQFLSSAMMDYQSFTTQLERSFRDIWHQWCEKAEGRNLSAQKSL